MDTMQRIQLRDELFEEFKSLKIFRISNGKYSIKKDCLSYELKNNIQLKEKYNFYVSQFRTEKEAKYCLIHQDDISNHLCPICGELCKFYNMRHGYRNTCTNKECSKKLYEKTCLEVYGKTNPAKNEKVKERIKSTNLRIYGYVCPLKNKKIRIKAIQTSMSHYNKPYPAQSEEVKRSICETNMKNRGVKYVFQDKNVKELSKNTMIKNHGAPHPMKCKKFKNKQRQTYIRNQNLKNDISNQYLIKVMNQIKSNNKTISAYDVYYDEKYFKMFIELLYEYKSKELIKLNEVARIFKRNRVTIKNKLEKLNLLEYFDIKDSKLELQFKELLESAGLVEDVDFERANRNILPKTENNGQPELDFYLSKYNIAFEINDVASHNITKQSNQFYHINKTLQCKERRIRLIHLWEWELIDENLWRRTSNWILNLLNLNKIKINSEDYIIKEIDNETAQYFITEYNIYNYKECDIALGLYYNNNNNNNKLLQVITFKRQNDNNFELLQFCTKFSYNIKDDIQCLFDYFIQQYNPQSIITTINLDKFSGTTFEEIEFKLIQNIEPYLIESVDKIDYKLMYNCGQNVYQLHN